jgi:hypothetical protein
MFKSNSALHCPSISYSWFIKPFTYLDRDLLYHFRNLGQFFGILFIIYHFFKSKKRFISKCDEGVFFALLINIHIHFGQTLKTGVVFFEPIVCRCYEKQK